MDEPFDIEPYLDEVDESEITLILTPTDITREVITGFVRYFTTEKNALCIYVTVNQPSSSMDELLREAGAKTENIFYIDCATQTGGQGNLQRSGNTVFVKPSQLTDLSIALTEVVGTVPEDREGILVFDTMSTLAIYNDTDTVSKFAHQMLSYIRQWDIKSIVLTLDDDTDEKVLSRLRQFSDRTITIGEDEPIE